MNKMNNAAEAILAVSACTAGSCVRNAGGEKKSAMHIHALATRKSRSADLHGIGTKSDGIALNFAKLWPQNHEAAERRKALAGCELQRSLARQTCRKKRPALNFWWANSFRGGQATYAVRLGHGEYAFAPGTQRFPASDLCSLASPLLRHRSTPERARLAGGLAWDSLPASRNASTCWPT